MPINTNNHKIGDLYSNIYKKKQINESTNNEVVKETLKSGYYSNTPFHKFQTDYSNMYDSYTITKILRESLQKDVNTVITLMEQDETLCNEIFGGVGQKIKQGVQAGAQAVQQRLVQPLIQLIISKLPKNKQEELAKAAEAGPQALQQFIQAEGDPKVAQEIAGQQVTESTDSNLLAIVELLTLLSENNGTLLNEDASQNKFNAFKKTLAKIASEVKDPAIKQQIDQLNNYIAQNYTTRGKFKQAAAPQTQATQPTTPQPGPLTAPQPGPLTSPQGGPLSPGAATQPPQPVSPQVVPPGTPLPPGIKNVTPQASGGLVSKALNWVKNNKTITAAGAIGLLGAVALATGGAGVLAPMLLPALKSAGVGAAIGAAKGAMGAKPGERLKGALKGAAAGGAVAGAGSLAGQALGDVLTPTPDENTTASALPVPQQEIPPGTSPEDVEAQYKAAGLTTPPEVTQQPAVEPEATPTTNQQEIPGPTPQEVAAQAKSGARGGAADLVARGNEAQNQMAMSKGLKPGYHWERDTLGRLMQVKNK